ncbi:MAG: hypothetical protein IPO43_15600 [Rhodoferax sp.]|nr:hypothetical protein [Rhodoferax sp.]
MAATGLAATAAPVGATAAAQRLPDGSVFVPKAMQRQLGIRTALAETRALSATVELNGRVMADPTCRRTCKPGAS